MNPGNPGQFAGCESRFLFPFAPGGFEQDGFMFKLVIGSGVYRYNTDKGSTERVIGFESTLQLLPSVSIQRGTVEMTSFWGSEFETHCSIA